jgi:hypothetical protein
VLPIPASCGTGGSIRARGAKFKFLRQIRRLRNITGRLSVYPMKEQERKANNILLISTFAFAAMFLCEQAVMLDSKKQWIKIRQNL